MVKIICTEKNGVNKTEVELSGEMDFITAQISYAIASMYTEIRKQDKNVGEAFRVSMTRAIARIRPSGSARLTMTRPAVQHSSARARS